MGNTTSLIKATQTIKNIEEELSKFPDFNNRWVKDKKYRNFLELLQSVIEGFSWVTEDIKKERLGKMSLQGDIAKITKGIKDLEDLFMSEQQLHSSQKEKYSKLKSASVKLEKDSSTLSKNIKNQTVTNNNLTKNLKRLKKEKEDLELENKDLKENAKNISITVDNYNAFTKNSIEINKLQEEFKNKGIKIQFASDKSIAKNLNNYNSKLSKKISLATDLIEEIESILGEEIIKATKQYEKINKRREEDV